LLNHDYIGTEHLLLGLIHQGDGVAARALESLDVSLEAVRNQVEEMIGRGQGAPAGHIPFTPRAKKVLELSLREARQLEHRYIGTEHILLGLVREGKGVAAQVLEKLGVDLKGARKAVIELVAGPTTVEAFGGETVEIGMGSSEQSSTQPLPRCAFCRRSLLETAVHRTIQVPAEEEDGEPVTVRIVFCKACGRTLATSTL